LKVGSEKYEVGKDDEDLSELADIMDQDEVQLASKIKKKRVLT